MRQSATPAADQVGELSPTRATALEALLAGCTVTEAAHATGVDRTTVHRWKSDPVFLAVYNGRRSEMREASEAELQQLQTKALEASSVPWTRGMRVSP